MKKDNAVARALRILELLAGRFYDGITIKELAEALRTSPPNACRDMKQLESLGWAHKLENGNWGLTHRPLSVMQAYAENHQTRQSRVAETQQNILSGARRTMN